MESVDKFYKNFVRPPFAPVYHPTAEEFADPIAYVAKIRPEAEHYGVVKIVPPDTFKPPFAIDSETFEFTPRVQRLNEIEAIVRERTVFTERLVHYWTLQGGEFKYPSIDGKFIDLFKFSKVIQTMGGYDVITKKKLWTQVAKKMTVKNSNGTSKLKDIYKSIVLPFLLSLEERVSTPDSDSDDEWKAKEDCKDAKEGATSMQGGRLRPPRQSRMMAGLAQPKSRMNHGRMNHKKADPMEHVFCMVCNRGDDEDHLLLCEDCDRSMHTTCCEPPLKQVPKGEWRCPQCVSAELSKIGVNFGFYDAETKYNIHSFSEYADNFKKNFFSVDDPRDVPDEKVEREFWRHVMDETTVAVKYGADLITSKVGSGFPRKGDDHRGPDARLKAHYANHAWNLNNLPVLKESVLSHIETGISGMMVPWVYVGMCFSTFCWHTEDHWTYSINYNHWGERKIWYGLGGQDAEKFEDLVREMAPGLTSRQKDIFHHMTTAVNPAVLRSKGLDVWTTHQNAGEFVVTFPRAYHAGFNEGVNFAEAVNFAPIDWLKMGRLCVNEYANVRRFCVFSHDELVLKMVQSCNKLGISMSLAALDELLMMSKRESTGRSLVLKSGIKRVQKENFEQLADDNRVCRHCNTTVFLSALSCAHNKTVCLEHIDNLCSKCKPSECILKYRYTMEELEPMIKQLEERTTLYFEWAEQVDNVLNDPRHKPMLSAVENLMETARQKRFPHAAPLQRLHTVSKSCHSALERARTLLNGKIRTRKETRIQRADTRLDLDGIRTLLEELDELPCDVQDTMDKLNALLNMISLWQEEARAAIAATVSDVIDEDEAGALRPSTSTSPPAANGKAVKEGSVDGMDNLRQLISRGEEFDVRTPEMEQLIRAVDTREWRRRAGRVLAWRPSNDMETDENFESRGRWELESVLKLIKDGSEIMRDGDPTKTVERLHARYKAAVRSDNMADMLLSSGNATLEQLEKLWTDARESDWCTAKGMDWMRREIVQARELRDGPGCSTGVITLKQVTDMVELCQKSAVLASTSSHKERLEFKDKLERFTKRLISLFKRPNSYYDLVEIVRDRDDLAALIEGQTVSRSLQTTDNLVDEWELLCEFDSVDEMKSHLSTLHDQQKNLMSSLQMANTQRSARDTCVCAMDKEENKSGGVITCILCRAKYHGVCCEWDAFLGRLPDGCFLCPRCLRGRRPCIEDVQATCNQAPNNSMEVDLVKQLLHRVRDCSVAAMDVLGDIALAGGDATSWQEPLKQKVKWVVESTLACELLDLGVFNKIVGLIPSICGDIMEQQREFCALVRDRPVRANPPDVLFVAMRRTGGKAKRSGAGRETSRRDRKRARAATVYHNDDQTCSADSCLKPYGDHVGWIQCEAGCARWYHYVCVGQTVEGAKSIKIYSCYRCSRNSQPALATVALC